MGKKFFTLLFLLIGFNCAFNNNYLFSIQQAPVPELLTYFDYGWSGNDKHLFFDMEIKDNLLFPDKYQYLQTQNSLSCLITLHPMSNHKITSSDGYQLQKIEFEVKVINLVQTEGLQFQLIWKGVYTGTNQKGQFVTRTDTMKRVGSLNVPKINIDQLPEFYINSDEPNKGYMLFKFI